MLMMPPRSALLSSRSLLTLVSLTTFVHGMKYDSSWTSYNLNTNRTADTPLDYWGQRDSNHTYHSSPESWRIPFYTVFMDRFVNGDPSNDNTNNTLFETDITSTQLRHGGDIQGLIDSLDYIAGMGIKVTASALGIGGGTRRVWTFVLTGTIAGHLHRRLALHEPALGRRRLLGTHATRGFDDRLGWRMLTDLCSRST
jgi:hypothetical protein